MSQTKLNGTISEATPVPPFTCSRLLGIFSIPRILQGLRTLLASASQAQRSELAARSVSEVRRPQLAALLVAEV